MWTLIFCSVLPSAAYVRLAPATMLRTAPVMQLHHQEPTRDAAPTRDRAPARDGALGAARVRGVVAPTSSPAPSNSPAPAANPAPIIAVQGGSLRTWSYRSPSVEQVQVMLTTAGRPLDASVELWQGSGNIPCKMRVWIENGRLRPFTAVLATPRSPTTVAIRNVGQMEFPFDAQVVANTVANPSVECLASAKTLQGGATVSYHFDPSVESVQVLLKSEGMPLNARIELIQGPDNNREVIELYTDDGSDRPFFCFLETPGYGSVVRILNTGPIAFPITASVVPHAVRHQWRPGAYRDADV